MKLGKYDNEMRCFEGGHFFYKGGEKTTKTGPSKEQRAIEQQKLDLSNRLLAGGELDFYGGDTVAPLSQYTAQGQQAQLGAAGDMAGMSQGILGAYDRGMNADMVNDPRTQALADAVTRPMQQEFQEQTLPGISSAAVKQGAFGGDRADVLKSMASRDYARSVGDVRAGVFADAQQRGMEHQLGLISNIPNAQQGLLGEAGAISDVGRQQEERSQAEIDAERERFEFGEYALTDLVNRVSAPLSGINMGSVTTQSGGGK